jgi:hypothetical protein
MALDVRSQHTIYLYVYTRVQHGIIGRCPGVADDWKGSWLLPQVLLGSRQATTEGRRALERQAGPDKGTSVVLTKHVFAVLGMLGLLCSCWSCFVARLRPPLTNNN